MKKIIKIPPNSIVDCEYHTGLDVIEFTKVSLPGAQSFYTQPWNHTKPLAEVCADYAAMENNETKSEHIRCLAHNIRHHFEELKRLLPTGNKNPLAARTAQIGIELGMLVMRARLTENEQPAWSGKQCSAGGKKHKPQKDGTVIFDCIKFAGTAWWKKSNTELWKLAGKNHGRQSFDRQVRRARASLQKADSKP